MNWSKPELYGTVLLLQLILYRHTEMDRWGFGAAVKYWVDCVGSERKYLTGNELRAAPRISIGSQKSAVVVIRYTVLVLGRLFVCSVVD